MFHDTFGHGEFQSEPAAISERRGSGDGVALAVIVAGSARGAEGRPGQGAGEAVYLFVEQLRHLSEGLFPEYGRGGLCVNADA